VAPPPPWSRPRPSTELASARSPSCGCVCASAKVWSGASSGSSPGKDVSSRAVARSSRGCGRCARSEVARSFASAFSPCRRIARGVLCAARASPSLYE
jgi:hypothetical protein